MQTAFLLVAAVLAALSQLSSDKGRAQVAVLVVLIVTVGWLAGVVYEVGSTRGASIGKWLWRLRIVDAVSGRTPTRRQALRRWLVVAGAQPLVWLALGGGSEPLPARVGLITAVAASMGLRGVHAVSILRTAGTSSIHDRFAHTRVV